MVGFFVILDTGWIEVGRLWVGLELVNMIKDADSKYDDYSILPKIRQILLHWGYELTENFFFIDLTN